MKAYLWKPLKNYRNKWIGVYNRELSPDRLIFFGGNFVDEKLSTPIIDFICPKERIEKFGSVCTDTSSPIVRDDVLDICADLFKDQIQTFDVELHTQNGILNNYKLINILNLVEGVNLEESICEYFTDKKTIRGYKYLVLKENCLENLNIARLKETLSHILVSEKVKERFEKYKIKGARFIEPEEYYGEIYYLEKVFAGVGRVWKGKEEK
ncbi:MAG: hypothetical protein C5B43_01740 [Verrucomicrobia bacterium]|nr:MAG: hypothetical protein C5B43_01740 [Verrucomicrobiota bacterium]